MLLWKYKVGDKMQVLRGVKDDDAVKIVCPKCKQLLLFVNKTATGRIYPYCKKCHTNFDFNLPLYTKLVKAAKNKTE